MATAFHNITVGTENIGVFVRSKTYLRKRMNSCISSSVYIVAQRFPEIRSYARTVVFVERTAHMG